MALPPAKRVKLDYTETVIITVGSDRDTKDYTLHKDILIRHSEFFKIKLRGTNKYVSLPGPIFTPELFSIYVQWAYSGELVILNSDQVIADTEGKRQNDLIIKLYTMTKRLKVLLLQNQLMDHWVGTLFSADYLPSYASIELAYQQPLDACMPQRVLLDHFLAALDLDWRDSFLEAIPLAFKNDLLVETLRYVRESETPEYPIDKDLCTYHEHNTEVPEC